MQGARVSPMAGARDRAQVVAWQFESASPVGPTRHGAGIFSRGVWRRSANNDVKTHAPFDAMNLAHRLGLGPAAPAGPEEGTVKIAPVRTGWPG